MTDSDSSMHFYILILVFLLFLSAFFSASETALSSCNRIRLKNIAKDGDKRAAKVLQMLDNFDNALSTILIGNNIVNIGAASIATVVFTKFFGSAGLTVSTAVMTILVLIFGEISPKSFAKDRPESFSMWCYPYLNFLMVIFAPLNVLFLQLKEALNKLIGSKNTSGGMTEDELKVMVDEVENEGFINKQESDLIKSAIEFNDIRVKEILTPRVDIVACDIEVSNAEILRTFASHGFSRLPIYSEDLDHIIGIVHSKDFYDAYLKDRKFNLSTIIKDIAYVHRSTKISLVLRTLQRTKVQMAIVIDSYGGVAGLVSIEDIVEELVGEIWDEHDNEVSVFHKIGEYKYLVSCNAGSRNASLHELFEYMQLDFNRYDLENQPISGWVVETLGEIPQKGDCFDYRNLHVVVNKTNLHRVLEIIVTVTPVTEDDDE
ncbi:hemolysin family protein [Phascolarctobacterium sp.]|uniref:HlyC/CorC family transporter n=1 Tax=Phascolarctobacterium sp. TaxID=2049039 RepID=UPI0015ACB118|nr:hemolysin family protein [uncultured Phascolarctobacterium sp.]